MRLVSVGIWWDVHTCNNNSEVLWEVRSVCTVMPEIQIQLRLLLLNIIVVLWLMIENLYLHCKTMAIAGRSCGGKRKIKVIQVYDLL